EPTDLESGCALRHDEIDGQSRQLGSEFGHTLDHVVAVTELDHEIAAFYIAEISKSDAHRFDVRHQARRLLSGEPADVDDFRHTLRGNVPRHGDHGEEGSQKHPSFHSITASGCLVFVTARCETSSRAKAYKKCLQHPAFLGVDFVRAFEGVIAS